MQQGCHKEGCLRPYLQYKLKLINIMQHVWERIIKSCIIMALDGKNMLQRKLIRNHIDRYFFVI